MKVLNYISNQDEKVTTSVLRCLENLVCTHRASLPNGWRMIIELQDSEGEQPYFILDVQSNQGGGNLAATKMQMLKRFPDRAHTGGDTPQEFRDILTDEMNNGAFGQDYGRANVICNQLKEVSDLKQLPNADWGFLQKHDLTHWYGGIRIPYDILVTDHGKEGYHITNSKGEVRIVFSGAKEWQDAFMAICLFNDLQITLNEHWSQDQIWWNLRGLENDPIYGFWFRTLKIQEAPL